MRKKPILCVAFGGKSNEYEVSLKSAYAVLSNIDCEKYEIIKIGITKEGKWYLFNGDISLIKNDTWWDEKNILPVTVDISLGSFMVFDKNVYHITPDAVLPVMHGAFGEDGRIQGLFEMSGIKCVGFSSFSSMIGMDKYLTKAVCDNIGIPNARYAVINKCDMACFDKICEKIEKIGYPVFIKPCRSGSSVGVTKVSDKTNLYDAVSKAFLHSDKVLAEEKISGKETEIALICEGGTLKFSTAGSLKYKSEFYDYDTKYNSNDVEYNIPADIPQKSYEKIKEYAKELFYALGGEGFCRMDFFVKENGDVIFNEVNTLPGFTDISMFPMLFMYDGYTFSSLVDAVIGTKL
jgi:D-alanine-D-alanine ligase